MNNKLKFHPFIVQGHDNNDEYLPEHSINSEQGRLYVKIGPLEIRIKQSEDGVGVIVEAYGAEACSQELGEMQLWFEDAKDVDEEDDGFGIDDITGIPLEELVKCNNCDKFYYDEPGDPRSTDCLQTMEDEEGTAEIKKNGGFDREFFRGCPKCKSDEALTDLVVDEE